jgi:hypothetical protein
MRFKFVFYWFILLCSVRFFDLKIFGFELISNLPIIGGVSLVLFVTISHIFEKAKPSGPRNLHLGFLLLALVASTISSYYFNGQPFLNSIISARIIFYYLFYIALHIINPSYKLIKKSIIVIACLHIIIFLVQFMVYPTEIVLSGMSPDRARVRIRMPGRSFTYFLAVWAFSILILKTTYPKIRVILIWALSILVILLTVTRTPILIVLVVHFLMLLKFKKKKIFNVIIPALITVCSFYILINIFDPNLLPNIINVSQQDTSSDEGNIRLLAYDHYMTDIISRPFAAFLGNGNPTGGENFSSAYSEKSKSEVEMGYFLDDLGIFGTVYRYGVTFNFSGLSQIAAY